jgi:hypothetical protein
MLRNFYDNYAKYMCQIWVHLKLCYAKVPVRAVGWRRNFYTGVSSIHYREKEKRMRLFAFVIFVCVMLLATCSAPQPTPAPVEMEVPTLPTASPQLTSTELPPTPTEAAPNPKLAAASFESQTYINEAAGFALDYPTSWTINEVVVGPRGTQVQFLSSPDIAELATVPEGATRVNATIYQWDPKNDLDAFVGNQKTVWESSGFTILEEEELVLELGLQAVRFTMQTPEANVVFLVTALGDQYLVLSGEGDLELVKEIVQRVRPISAK